MAGVSAALWCKRLGMSPVIVEKSNRLGGQLHQINLPLIDYAGFSGSASELVQVLEAQITAAKVPCLLNRVVTSVDYENNQVMVSGHPTPFDALILATGSRKRPLPQLHLFHDTHVHMSATGLMPVFKGRHVAIVGGGDGAYENALILANNTQKVTLIVRSNRPRARQQFVREVNQHPNIEVRFQCEVSGYLNKTFFEGVTLKDSDGSTEELYCDHLVIKCGYCPESTLFPEQSTSPAQLQLTDGVWAIGDVCNETDPCLSVCVGEAAKAAREIQRYLSGKEP